MKKIQVYLQQIIESQPAPTYNTIPTRPHLRFMTLHSISGFVLMWNVALRL